jgi:hypothetical protein
VYSDRQIRGAQHNAILSRHDSKWSVDKEAIMSKLSRILALGALLAATSLAGMTGVAHAQATDASTAKHTARRPPTQTQVGEDWHQHPAATNQQTFAGDTRRPPTEGQVGEPWHLRVHAPTPPAEPDGQPRWPVASLAVLAAALALAGGLAAERASRKTRIGHAA